MKEVLILTHRDLSYAALIRSLDGSLPKLDAIFLRLGGTKATTEHYTELAKAAGIPVIACRTSANVAGQVKTLIGLKPRSRWPTEPSVRIWSGLPHDLVGKTEAPQTKMKVPNGKSLFNTPTFDTKTVPILWRINAYPLCGLQLHSDGSCTEFGKAATTKEIIGQLWHSEHPLPKWALRLRRELQGQRHLYEEGK